MMTVADPYRPGAHRALGTPTTEPWDSEDGAINDHDLVMASDIGEMLGVTRQRVSQIVWDGRNRFPAPKFHRRKITLWNHSDVVQWGIENGYLEGLDDEEVPF